MPVGLGSALKIGGSLLGGALGGGNKSKTNSSSTTSGSSSSTSRGTQEGFQEVLENPLLQPLRAILSGSLLDTLADQSGPVFGEAQIAKGLQDINDLTETASGRLRSRLAASGGLQSGSLAAGLADIEGARLGQQTNFLTQLPFQEKQAQLQRILPLLNLGLGFTGRGPNSVRTTGSFENTRESDFNQSTQGQSTTRQGGGFLSNLAGGAGSLLGADFLRSDILGFPSIFGGGGSGSDDFGPI